MGTFEPRIITQLIFPSEKKVATCLVENELNETDQEDASRHGRPAGWTYRAFTVLEHLPVHPLGTGGEIKISFLSMLSPIDPTIKKRLYTFLTPP